MSANNQKFFDPISEVEEQFKAVEELLETMRTERSINLDSQIEITISDDYLESYITISPPQLHGKILNLDQVKDIISNAGIKEINEKIVADALKYRKFHEKFKIAEGKKPTSGLDAYLSYKFGISEEKDELFIGKYARAGQLLGIKISPGLGEPGITVTGEYIPPLLGRDLELISDRNTYLSKDNLKIYATSAGNVFWKGNTVTVEPLLEIEETVSKDIEFIGRVIIKGSVEKGVSIKATGGVYVKGSIASANIKAGGNVECSKDIFNTTIRAEGNICAETLKECIIDTKSDLIVNTIIIDSTVSARNVLCESGKGVISGGKIIAKSCIHTRVIGDQKPVPIEVRVEREDGKICVAGTIFNGVKITIGTKVTVIRKPFKQVTLKIEGGGIVHSLYEKPILEEVKKAVVAPITRGRNAVFDLPYSVVVTANNETNALGYGSMYLSIPPEKLVAQSLEEGGRQRNFWVFPADTHGPWQKDWEDLTAKDADGQFKFINQVDGLFLSVSPSYGSGKDVLSNEVIESLTTQEFVDIDYEKIKETVAKKESMVKIGPSQLTEKIGGKISVTCSADKKSAYLTITPPISGPLLVKSVDVTKFLDLKRITTGIDKEAIDTAIQNKLFNTSILIASAIPPEDGTDATIDYQFGMKEGQIYLAEEAIPGQLLMVKSPSSVGKAGYDVIGSEIPATKGVDITIIAGEGTYWGTDFCSLYARCKGKVIWHKNKVVVEDVLDIHGNADSDIDFPGKIVISGSVVNGVSIKALNDINILGSVGKASVESGKSISISNDILGDSNTKIIASRDVTASTAKEAIIYTQRTVSIDLITNCQINAKRINATMRKGQIIGGRVYASEEIQAKIIGDKTLIPTEVKVGKTGKISVIDTIFPPTTVVIGERNVNIRKPLKKLVFKLEGGRIVTSTYTASKEDGLNIDLDMDELSYAPPAIPIPISVILLDDIEVKNRAAQLIKLPEEEITSIPVSQTIEGQPLIRLFKKDTVGPWMEEWFEGYIFDLDGRFQFINRTEGLYLEFTPPRGIGKPVALNVLQKALEEGRFVDIDYKKVEEGVQSQTTLCIGPHQYSRELIEVEIPWNKMEAMVIIKTPSAEESVTTSDVLQALNEAGVNTGIDKSVISRAIESFRFNIPIVCARALDPPVDATGLLYQFGRIKGGEICIGEETLPGQLLSCIIPPDQILAGRTVTGESIPLPPGKELKLLPGKNAFYADDMLHIYAKSRGKVRWDDGVVFVEEILNIEGNVDSDITYDGRVVVSGGIANGVKIDTSGDLVISGNVGTNVVLKTGGNLILHQELIGGNEGISIIAEGDVSVPAIKGVVVNVKGQIITEQIVDAQVSAGRISVAGKRGKIIGGQIYASNKLHANTIGAATPVPTLVKVDKGGEIIAADIIFTKVTVMVADKKVEIRKPFKKVAFKLEGGRIISRIYTPPPEEGITSRPAFLPPSSPPAYPLPPSVVLPKSGTRGQSDEMLVAQASVLLSIATEGLEIIPYSDKGLVRVVPRGVVGAWADEWFEGYMPDADGRCAFINTIDGLYLEVKPSRGTGLPISSQNILTEITEQGFVNINPEAIIEAVRTNTLTKIGPRQYPHALITIVVPPDKMKAEMIIRSPKNSQELILPEDILQALNEAGVVSGINESAIREAVASKQFERSIVVAEAIVPESQSLEAYLEYQLGQLKESSTPVMGKVMITDTAIPGQLLAVKRSPQLIAGLTVTGEPIASSSPVDINLIPGKNTFLEDNDKKIYASKSGKVTWAGYCVSVEQTLEILGAPTSAINYDGKLIIKGSVPDEIRVEATGDITIDGGVGKSEIISGGSVEVIGDIIGMGGANIVAQQNILAQSASKASLNAGGTITIESITDCAVTASKIIAMGRKGQIVGGKVEVQKDVFTGKVGTKAGIPTEIKIGKQGKISISDAIFPKVLIISGTSKMPIRRALKKITFKAEGGRLLTVKYEPYQEDEITEKICIYKHALHHPLPKILPPRSVVVIAKDKIEAKKKGQKFVPDIPKSSLQVVPAGNNAEGEPLMRLCEKGVMGPWKKGWVDDYTPDANGTYEFINKADGLYLDVKPPRGTGEKVTASEVIAKAQNYVELDYETIEEVCLTYSKKKIAPHQYIPNRVIVEILEDKTSAFATILPPGYLEVILKEDVIQALNSAGVLSGIDESAITTAIKNKAYNTPFIAANAILPSKEAGNAQILYQLGRVGDQIKIWGNAIPGQIIAVKQLPRLGEAGQLVTGEIIPAIIGDETKLTLGRGTYLSNDKRLIIARTAGTVTWYDQMVEVVDTLEISGNVDKDINAAGKIWISGSVMDGVKLNAGSDVTILGGIGKAEIISGGNIQINQDIIGWGEAVLRAEGDILAPNAKDATLISKEGRILIDSIINCNVEAAKVLAAERKGQIVGGKIYARSEIYVKFLGAKNQVPTEVSVDKGGKIFIDTAIFPEVVVMIGDKKLKIRKMLKRLMFKLEGGRLVPGSYVVSEENGQGKVFIPQSSSPDIHIPYSILIPTHSPDEALSIASEFLGIPRNELTTMRLEEAVVQGFNLASNKSPEMPKESLIVVFEKGVVGPWSADWSETYDPNAPGQFKLINLSDGLYLEISPPRGKGQSVEENLILDDISSKGFLDIDLDKIRRTFLQEERIKIGPHQYVPDTITVEISGDNMEAMVILNPYEMEDEFTLNDLIAKLNSCGVIAGIDTNTINEALKERSYGVPIIAAKVILPSIEGCDAQFLYQFGIKKDEELVLGDDALPGQLLVVKRSEMLGREGKTVMGEIIPAIKGKGLTLICGENIYMEENNEMTRGYALRKGKVEWNNGRIDLYPTLEINGNCIEDQEFDGRIIISGSVIDGVKIRCKGDIKVMGSIGRCELNANGRIFVSNIEGFGEAEINAGKSVHLEIAKGVKIHAQGIVYANIVTDCEITANRVVLTEGKGQIIGGKVHACDGIYARIIGAKSSVATEVRVDKGIISVEEIIFSQTKVIIGRKEVHIRKPFTRLIFKLEGGRIVTLSYDPLKVDLKEEKEIPESTPLEMHIPPSVIVEAASREDALNNGAKLLNLSTKNLQTLTVPSSQDRYLFRVCQKVFGPWTEDWIEGYNPDADGTFEFINKEDGLYLHLGVPRGKGRAVTEDDVLTQIKEKGFSDIDISAIDEGIKTYRMVKIGPRQYIKGIVNVSISDDHTQAHATIIPPKVGGVLIKKEDVFMALKESGIVACIKEDAISHALQEGIFNTPILIAETIEPEKSKEPTLEFLFDIEPSKINFKVDDSGKIDFRETNLFVTIKEGEPLVIKHPGEMGQPGQLITGEIIQPASVEDISLPAGKNTKISDDGLTLYATVSGQVSWSGGRVNIEPICNISGDVNLQTGNIHFAGTVIISGNVENDFTVEADGDIQIRNSVGKSRLVAGGNIIIGLGIQGATVEAGENISAKFVDNAEIRAGKDVIISEEIVHSHIDAEGLVSMPGRRGRVIGGRIRAGRFVEVKELGGPYEPTTIIEVGLSPKIREEILQLSHKIPEDKRAFTEVHSGIKTLLRLKEKAGNLPLEKEEILTKFINAQDMLGDKIKTIMNTISNIKEKTTIFLSPDATVIVHKTIYPRVKLSIGTVTIEMRNEVHNAKFSLVSGKICTQTIEKEGQ